MTKQLSPEEIVKSFKDEFKTKIKEARIEKRTKGPAKHEFVYIWMKVDNSVFKDTVKHLATLQEYPHLAVAARAARSTRRFGPRDDLLFQPLRFAPGHQDENKFPPANNRGSVLRPCSD